MRAFISRGLAALVGITLSSGAVLAQANTTLSPIALSVPSASESARGTYNADQVRTRLDHAHQLCEEGRWREGLREYAAIARLQQQHQVLPTEALWQVANLYHNSGRLQRAASALDQLAAAAALHGDPVTHARALLESAMLYRTLQRPVQARMRLERLDPLLSSPFLSDEERQSLESRIIRG